MQRPRVSYRSSGWLQKASTLDGSQAVVMSGCLVSECSLWIVLHSCLILHCGVLGVCCWEILMRGVKPFVGIKNDEVISRIEMGERLPLPAEAPAPLFGLMNRCWSYEPEKRPDFSLVEATIAKEMEEERQLASLTSRRLAPPDLAPQKPPYRPHSSQSFVQVPASSVAL